MKYFIAITGFAALTALAGCIEQEANADAARSGKPTVQEAEAFVAEVNDDIRSMTEEGAKAAWVATTFITPDTQYLSAKSSEKWLNWLAETVEESKRFNDLELTGKTARAIRTLQVGTSMPAPSDPEKIAELAKISSELQAMYGAGKYCPEGEDGKCYSLGELENIIDDPASSFDDKLMAWKGWRTISPPMKEMYKRFVELTNEGAKELGFENTGTLWRSGYDMEADEFSAVTEKLWEEVSPLYDALHCYVRDELAEHYGEDKVPAGEPIPAHLLGNMWSQEWGNIYPLVEPHKGVSDINVTASLQKMRQQHEDELLAKLGSTVSSPDSAA